MSDNTFYYSDPAYKDTFYKAYKKMMDANDICAVIYPTYLSTPLRSGIGADGKYWSVWDQTLVGNCSILSPCTRIPEITVPMGLHSMGCGIGLSISSAMNKEQLLLDIAYSYTNRYDHRVTPTGAPDSYASYNVGTLAEIIEAYKQYAQSQQPTTKPTEPTTQPTKPTTQPTIPTTTVPLPTTTIPTIPTTQPTVPTTQPTVPTTQPTVPTTQPTVPTTQPTEPTTQPTAPTTSTSAIVDVPQSGPGVILLAIGFGFIGVAFVGICLFLCKRK